MFFFHSRCADLLFVWHFGIRTYYAYALHLQTPPLPHHIRCDKFLNDHKTKNQLLQCILRYLPILGLGCICRSMEGNIRTSRAPKSKMPQSCAVQISQLFSCHPHNIRTTNFFFYNCTWAAYGPSPQTFLNRLCRTH